MTRPPIRPGSRWSPDGGTWTDEDPLADLDLAAVDVAERDVAVQVGNGDGKNGGRMKTEKESSSDRRRGWGRRDRTGRRAG
jgi:hypothetical protein